MSALRANECSHFLALEYARRTPVQSHWMIWAVYGRRLVMRERKSWLSRTFMELRCVRHVISCFCSRRSTVILQYKIETRHSRTTLFTKELKAHFGVSFGRGQCLHFLRDAPHRPTS